LAGVYTAVHSSVYLKVKVFNQVRTSVQWRGKYWTNYNDPSCSYPTEI